MVAFDQLLSNIKSKHILISYSPGGRATRQQLMDLLCRDRNLVKFLRIDYKENVMSLMTSTAEWVTEIDAKHQEYLILLESK